MKQKSTDKKLSLNKKTVVNLDAIRLFNVRGGVADTDICPVGETDGGWSFCFCQTEAPTCPLTCTGINCPTFPNAPYAACEPVNTDDD